MAREAQTKPRRLTAPLAMLVRQTECLRRSGDVEQQRVRHDDEQNVDQMRACDHCQTWPGPKKHISSAAPTGYTAWRMSENDRKSSAGDAPDNRESPSLATVAPLTEAVSCSSTHPGPPFCG